jgi:hypothetical protein
LDQLGPLEAETKVIFSRSDAICMAHDADFRGFDAFHSRADILNGLQGFFGQFSRIALEIKQVMYRCWGLGSEGISEDVPDR